MSDLGVKVSLLGYDVQTAADQDLTFSSSWPLLKLHAAGTTTIADLGVETKLYNHNLGYPPIFLVGFLNYSGSPTSSTGDYAELFSISSGFSVDNNSLYWNGVYFGTDVRVFYRIYRYDITSNYTAPIKVSARSNQGIVNSDYGIKVAKPGKSITSTDLRDFTIHSNARSPQIHMSVSSSLIATTDDVAGYEVKARHGLGYPPFFLAYYFNLLASTPRWERVPTGTGGAVGAFVSADAVKVGVAATAYSSQASVIVFKDPFFLTTTTGEVVV